MALIEPHQYKFLQWLAIYLVTTLAYSLRLKRVIMVDVIVLSGLYTIRILAGSAATGVAVSTWLAGFSIFFFLSLAFVKRFAELESLRERGGVTAIGRGYHVSDLEQFRSFGSASAYASVVVLTLYISNLADSAHLYSHANRLWLLVPVLLLWLSRLWLVASRGHLARRPRRLRHHRPPQPLPGHPASPPSSSPPCSLTAVILSEAKNPCISLLSLPVPLSTNPRRSSAPSSRGFIALRWECIPFPTSCR